MMDEIIPSILTSTVGHLDILPQTVHTHLNCELQCTKTHATSSYVLHDSSKQSIQKVMILIQWKLDLIASNEPWVGISPWDEVEAGQEIV